MGAHCLANGRRPRAGGDSVDSAWYIDPFIGKPGRDLAHGELRAMSFEVRDMTFLSRH